MIDTINTTHIHNDDWRQHNAALLIQAEDERAQRHLWNAALTLAQYHDAEEKRELVESSEVRSV